MSVLMTKMLLFVLAFYGVVSLVTFVLYAVDKSAARKGGRRTRESTLHLFSLAGGWPGALIAQHNLRHITRKRSFRVVFWVTVLMNCSVLIGVLMPPNIATL